MTCSPMPEKPYDVRADRLAGCKTGLPATPPAP